MQFIINMFNSSWYYSWEGGGVTMNPIILSNIHGNGWMSRLYGASSGWHLLRGVCSKLVNQLSKVSRWK